MKIKICGLTAPEEAEYLNKNHVDFAGFVLFFPKSKRNISIDRAKEIMSKLSPNIKKVAVVVEPSLDQITLICQAGFDYIQIHGRLTDSMLHTSTLPILKAFNIKDMADYATFKDCLQIAGYVFDALEPGSGKTFDWKLVKDIPKDNKLLLLAGGLHPDNVADAISAISPDGVDVSSGVEYGKEITGKDPDKIDRFVSNVRNAASSKSTAL